jgi:hypothetical protein
VCFWLVKLAEFPSILRFQGFYQYLHNLISHLHIKHSLFAHRNLGWLTPSLLELDPTTAFAWAKTACEQASQ